MSNTDKAYSINQEDWNYRDIGDVFDALDCDGNMAEGAIYYESDCEPIALESYMSAGALLDLAQENLWSEIGEAADDAFAVSDEAVKELDDLLDTWTRKHITGTYWRCTGKVRELRVTAEEAAGYAND